MAVSPGDVVVVAAFAALGATPYDVWPAVATHLLAAGAAGDATARLAGLDLAPYDHWDVAELLPAMLRELGAAPVPAPVAVVAGVVADVVPDEPAALRLLDRLYVAEGPDGPPELVEASYAAEFLDCGCAPDATPEAAPVLAALRGYAPADLDPDLGRLLLRLTGRA